MKALAKNVGAVISAYVKKEIALQGSRNSLVDQLIAGGYGNPALYSAPAKGEDRTFYDSLKSAIAKGFPAEAQMLLNANSKEEQKALTGAQMEERRALQQDVSTYLANIRNAVKRRKGKAGKGAKPRTFEEVFISALEERAKSIRANGKDKPYDTLKVLGLIKDLKAELSKTA